MKILIVDDIEINLYMLSTLLTGNGYKVEGAMNGEEALKKLHTDHFDLIISDILMPIMDGFTLCMEVRKSSDVQHIPFIIYTATYTGPKDEDFALEIGANRFVVKPCEPDIFLNIVKDVIAEINQKKIEAVYLKKDEEEILKLYNERLVRKLEQKMLEIEKELTTREIVEEALRRSQTLLNATQRLSKIAGWEWDIIKQEMYWTDQVYSIFEIDHDIEISTNKELVEQSLNCFNETDRKRLSEAFQLCVESGILYEMETQLTTVKGKDLFIRTAGQPVYENGFIVKIQGYFEDCTNRKVEEMEQERTRQQFLQSQKLESLGLLAGGVAHDFNNILTVIIGYCEILKQSVSLDFAYFKELEEISNASKRASDLTRQLLIFSRKHIAQPKILDLNVLVKDLENMLGRLIGENFSISTNLCTDLSKIKADQGQIQQVIMNLVINSRDAMPTGGLIKIETSNITINEINEAEKLNINCGDYIILSISDTGTGMTKDTMDKLFEPFFTTKEIGKGTGLGLSTVYGIVKQAGGGIIVNSEIDKGTTFYIYLPTTTEKPNYKKVLLEENDLMGNGELILIAEDEIALRNLIEKMIKNMGYEVIAVSNGEEAIQAIKIHGKKPDLLLTDVVMPGMNGKELLHNLRETYPELKVLFMSGYTDNTIIDNNGLFPDSPFILKPFTVAGISRQIKQILNPYQFAND